MKIQIIKSKIPILWLDTSILSKICVWKETPEKLEQTNRKIISRLYELVYQNARSGKLICPLGEQEREVWINRSEWMDTVHELSLGIECISEKEIQDRQSYKAMKAYVDNKQQFDLPYTDAFDQDPVDELNEVLQKPIYVTVNYDILFGAKYQKSKKKQLIDALNKQRERNVQNRISYNDQLKAEETGSILTIIQMAKDLLEGKKLNEENGFNALGALVSIETQLQAWEMITGSRDMKALIDFYNSEHYLKCPYNLLSTRLFSKIMIDPQPIRSGDPMDIKHISSIMPYSDLFITDKAWSAFINRESLAEPYKTTVCYIGDFDIIEQFFNNCC